MYALRSPIHRFRQPVREDRVRSSVPYCFVLDETYHVIMAGPPDQSDPLAAYYDIEAPPGLLPEAVDRVVRALTASWRATAPASTASASLAEFQLTVAPLHGDGGRRMVVFIQRINEA